MKRLVEHLLERDLRAAVRDPQRGEDQRDDLDAPVGDDRDDQAEGEQHGRGRDVEAELGVEVLQDWGRC